MKVIKIAYAGQLGNRMLQYMLARAIQSQVPEAIIVDGDLPEWDIASDSTDRYDIAFRKLAGHTIPFEKAIDDLGRGDIEGVLLKTCSMRIQYYAPYLDLHRTIFSLQRVPRDDYETSLFIHVRLNRMAGYNDGHTRNMHRDYPVVPLSYYHTLLEQTGLKPVFVGEFGDDPVSDAYRVQFPGAEFIRSERALDDFQLLYSATNIAISPSSFSWLAAWLSPYSRKIILPILGFLNPTQRSDADMLPTDDPRYEFYAFPAEHWQASADQIDRVISGAVDVQRMSATQVHEVYKTQLDKQPMLGSLPKKPTVSQHRSRSVATTEQLERLYQRTILTHIRIPGANTDPLTKALQTIFGPDRFLLRNDDGRTGLELDIGHRVACVSLDVSAERAAMAVTPRRALLAALVPDPLERARAAYNRDELDPALVADHFRGAKANAQCRFFGGTDFATARQAIKDQFLAITATEDAASLIELLRPLGFQDPSCGSMIQALEREPALPTAFLNLIGDALDEDRRLFDWIARNRDALFERGLAKIGKLIGAA